MSNFKVGDEVIVLYRNMSSQWPGDIGTIVTVDPPDFRYDEIEGNGRYRVQFKMNLWYFRDQDLALLSSLSTVEKAVWNLK